MTPIDWDALARAAIATRQRAHAPYSRYRVGAALVTDDGVVHAGCNVENATYGLTICAERTAVVSMVAAGGKRVAAIAVVTQGPTAGSPCGACRQTLAEFAADAPVLMLAVDDDGVVLDRRESTVDTLLPDAFRGDRLLGGE
jgi:cytidine deaminase